MSNNYALLILLIIFGCVAVKTGASPQSGAIARKTFDFVVGAGGDFKAVMAAATRRPTSANGMVHAIKYLPDMTNIL